MIDLWPTEHCDYLREGDCRWPAGYGPYLFCGRPICAGSSYCAEHYAASTRLPYRWEARA